MKNKKLISLLVFVSIFTVTFFMYAKFVSPTKIGLINYPDFLSSKMSRSTSNFFIQIDVIEQDNLPNLKQYDMLFIFGMGLKLTAEQEEKVKLAGNKGVSIYLQASTVKGLELTNLADEKEEQIKSYLDNGGNKNFSNLMRYVRTDIDQKKVFVDQPKEIIKIASDVLFYIDEDVVFEEITDFEKYCKTNNFHKDGQKKVMLFTSVPGPFNANREHLNSLIQGLQERNLNVYPVSGFGGRINYMKEINPDIIVYMPHGRLSMGGSSKLIDDQLKKMNIPVLCPITVHQRYDEWLKDKNGMMGGLLSQSITMPEFDGGIVPYAVFAEYEDKNGFVIFKAVPNRLMKFCDMVENYLSLQEQQNKDKKIAIVYFKGPGKNALTASNMEVLPSLHNVLLRLKKEGYNLGDLPENYKSFEKTVMAKGPILGSYAEGAFDVFLNSGYPELVAVDDYYQWAKEILPEQLMLDVEERYGKAPGSYMDVYKEGKEYIAVARVQFGNVVLLPQQLPGLGDNAFALIHGAKVAPPHTYIAPYLWIQKSFQADAIFHFGTHGSLEFTPGKQIALSDYDWTDPLIGTIPHNYIYTISNVGEGMIAKRRSYAATQTYLTPPFMAAKAMQSMQILQNKLNLYEQAKGALKREYALSVKDIIMNKGMHKELGLDSITDEPYSDQEMTRILNFVEELSHEKVTGGLYTMGVPYTVAKLDETILMMHNDELAYHLAEVDVLAERVTREKLKDRSFFRRTYADLSQKEVEEVIRTSHVEASLLRLVKKRDIQRTQAWVEKQEEVQKMAMESRAKPQQKGKEKKTSPKDKQKFHVKATQGHENKSSEEKMGHEISKSVDAKSGATQKQEVDDPKEKAFAEAVLKVENTLKSILIKKQELKNSPEMEMQGILNALNGGFTPPSPGGDPIANPETVPTGRNLFSVNAEQTPSKEAWKVAKKLGDDLLVDYKEKHGHFPKKISFTLWSSSFIESEGITIAQILYMLGIEPVWTPRGKVNDIRLMSEDELGRPRIDVVVQTSGQLRDLAASRLVVITRAIAMAAEAGQEKSNNYVAKGIKDAEKLLIKKGFSPKQARAFAGQRVFGGVNGNYGASIMGMVENSDRWDSTNVVAKTYINNMGAFYGSDEEWGDFNAGVFEAALLNTEAVVQPRQSNTWGALSLDHVYEFMGGLNLAVKEVTGNDAESYFNDFRNSSNPRIQGLKEAIGVESRTTLLNERYIKEYMKGGASSADVFAETLRNTFGWNVMKPSVIEDRLWDDLYDVYVEDKLKLNVHEFFERENPYALQEMTAVMLEIARKGMWDATPDQIRTMAELHVSLVKEYEAGCSGFVCDNTKLRDFITQNISDQSKEAYAKEITKVRESKQTEKEDNVVLKKEDKKDPQQPESVVLTANLKMIIGIALVVFLVLFLFIRKRRK